MCWWKHSNTFNILQHLTPSHNTIHHQGAGQQEELCTIIYPATIPATWSWYISGLRKYFCSGWTGWWERHEMGGKCRACFVHFNILTCCRVPPRFPGNRGHSMLTLILWSMINIRKMRQLSAKIPTDVTSGFKNLCYPSQTANWWSCCVEKCPNFNFETIC